MTAWWREIKKARAGAREFKALPRANRRIAFYAEGRGYWSYFSPVFEALRARGEEVLYVTSGEDDPLLAAPPPGLRPFYIGGGSVRTLFFIDLEVDVLVTTTPDLQNLYLKRSPHGVHYVYLHHSLVSTHMVYREAAFDHFDSVLCAGPHHVAEIRAREKAAGLPAKALVEHGYGRLDTILSENQPGPRASGEAPRVIIAPSWGDDALFERHGAAVVEPLIAAGFHVVARPHPRTLAYRPEAIASIAGRYSNHTHFRLDTDAESRQSLADADLMVSDWSGAALEYALGLERPVLFVDVPRKCLNPAYMELGTEPLEARIRNEIGELLPPEALGKLGERALAMYQRGSAWQQAIQEARKRWVFNPGRSGEAAAAYICSVIEAKLKSRAA